MIIMTDLDDTLLNSNGEISEFTKSVLLNLPANYQLVFNSARSLTASAKISEILKPSYKILNAGSTIYDYFDNLIYSNPISPSIVREIVSYLKQNQIYNILIEAGSGFLSDNLAFIATHNYVSYADIDNFSIPAYKIVYHHSSASLGQNIAKKYNFDFTTYVNSNIHKISKTDKGMGVKAFRKIINDANPIMAFGDDLGDISMLLEADIPVKMANSNQALLKYDFATCSSNDLDGVANYVLDYIKKKEGN